MKVNSVAVSAAIDGATTVTSITEKVIDGLTTGDAHYFDVTAVNSFGTGLSTTSNPVSKQPIARAPGVVQNLRANVGADRMINVQFDEPIANGGEVVTHYRVQYDSTASFDSSATFQPFKDIEIKAAHTKRRPDVQFVTVVSELDYFPGGSFVLNFLGQNTPELDYNITASGMKLALEKLSTIINSVSVDRELFCTNDAGVNNCGPRDRGYVWKITFNEVIEYGIQTEPYISSYDTFYNQRLSVSGDFLVGCDGTDINLGSNAGPTYHGKFNQCFVDKTVAYVDAYAEKQALCLCDTATTTISFMGQTVTAAADADRATGAQNLKDALESITGVGHVTVVPTYPEKASTSCGCAGDVTNFMVSFDTYVGDAPAIDVGGNGIVTEVRKGKTQMVTGISDYSLDLLIDDASVSSDNEFFVRVAAVNSVGTSQYASPFQAPVVLYEGTLPAPHKFVYDSSPSASSLRFTWEAPINITDTLYNYQNYVLQYDTNPTFSSYCSNAVAADAKYVMGGEALDEVTVDQLKCQNDKVLPMHTFNVDGALLTTDVNDLTPGQEYYARIKVCRDLTVAGAPATISRTSNALLSSITEFPTGAVAGNYTYAAASNAGAVDGTGLELNVIVSSRLSGDGGILSDSSMTTDPADCIVGVYHNVPITDTGGGAGYDASATVVCGAAGVSKISVTNGDHHYEATDTVEIAAGLLGANSNAVAFLIDLTDVVTTITSVTVADGTADIGSGYSVGETWTWLASQLWPRCIEHRYDFRLEG